jgi:hypothetical protein
VFILWEALSSQRPLITSGHMATALEWKRVLPGSTHNRDEGPKIMAYVG